MNKKILAVAIAAAMAAPFAMADEGSVTISGNLGVGVTSIKNTDGDRTSDVTPGGSDLTISGFEDLGNGLKAVFVIKSWLNVTGRAGGGSDSDNLLGKNKDAYVGLAGNFGTVALGAHGQPYKTATGGLELFGDTIGDARGSVTNSRGYFHTGINDAVIWFLPNINGFSGHLQWGSEDNGNRLAYDTQQNPWGAQVNYSNGPLYVTLAHADEDWVPSSDSYSATKAGASYAFGDTKLVGTYEWNNDKGSDGKYESYSLGVAQKFGVNTVKLQYASENSPSDSSLWAVGLDHALSKRTGLYAVYADGDNLGDSSGLDNGLEVGINHSF